MTLPDTTPQSRCDVAVVGGGTAGLALATELKRQGVGDVVVLEREAEAGGIPRHCGHYPFGIREYGRLLKGPVYAARNVDAALKAGVDIRTGTTVTALHPNGRLSIVTSSGTKELQAIRVVLCTGVREASRAQRFISGDRPLGVMSTGALQTMVYLQGMQPFSRPIIFGSELVSFSAINTCRHLGIRPVAMVEEHDRIVARRIVRPYLTLRGVPLFVGVQKPHIIGDKSVEAIEFTDANGTQQRLETDGIIISGRFRPEAALLHLSHLEVDSGTGGPVIDQFGQCSDPAFYSAGNLLRPAETSGWCWHEGVATAKRIAEDLAGRTYVSHGTANLCATDPDIRFVVPQRLTLTDRPNGMDRMQVGLQNPVHGILVACIDDACISRSKINARPVRRIQMPLTKINSIAPDTIVELRVRKV